MTTTGSLKKVPLRYIVLGILSIAARENRPQIPVTEFYRLFAEMVDDVGESLPAMAFTRTDYSAYSKRLDEALQSLVGYSLDLPNPRLRYLELQPDAADRHLKWLDAKFEEHSLVGTLEPLVRRWFLTEPEAQPSK